MKHLVASAAIVLGFAILLPELEAQATGTITGVVTTKAVGARPIRVTMDQRVCGNDVPDEAVVVAATGHLANAVVTLTGVKGGTAPASSAVMNEKCRFSPRVQVVRPNATVVTSSKDPILHTTNAITEGGRGLFNVAVPAPGIKISKSLNTPQGIVRLTCNTHPWMRGYIIVTDDMAAVTGADGKFTLSNVPAGTYELRVWHESLKGSAQKVTVRGSQPTAVTFEMK
jgi:hypothetical protein